MHWKWRRSASKSHDEDPAPPISADLGSGDPSDPDDSEDQSQPAKGLQRPPGPAGLVTWMSVASGRTQFFDFVAELSAEHPLSYAKLPGAHAYCLSDPDLIWQTFVTDDEKLERGPGLRNTGPILGNGLLNSDGDEHRRRRALMDPALHGQQVNSYLNYMLAAIDDLDRDWSQRSGLGQTEISVVEEMSGLSMDVIERAIFGSHLSEDPEISESLESVLATFNKVLSPSGALLTRFPTRARRRMTDAVGKLDTALMELISQKRTRLAAGESAGCAISFLLSAHDPESGDPLTDKQVRDEVMALTLAGYETTAMLLSWTWLELSLNTAMKVWVSEEWDELAPFSGDARQILDGMPRTRAVLAESMRLHPPAWVLVRGVIEDLELDEFEVPAGSLLLTSQYAMHRDERFWSNAQDFDPERWLDSDGTFNEQAPGQPAGAWFPFGFADRRCLGDEFSILEAALTLARIGRSWHVTAVAPGAVVPAGAATLRPANGIPARIRARQLGV